MSILIKDKIAVITDCNPFESTPQQRLAEELCLRLQQMGHDSYVIKVPVDWRNGDALMQSILSLRLLKVMNSDAVVAVDFPTAIVQHHNKYAWITDTTENIARQRFEAALAEAPASEIVDAEQTPHRLTVIQDLLVKIENSYLSECKRLIYCHNALLRSNDSKDRESEAEFSNLTNLLKSALSKLTADSDVEEAPHLQNLLIPAFEKTDEYLARLPWEPISRYLTRTLEIE
ncbi:MAG: hypothetical protein P4L53_21200 [Candidatus Obscuribacterales bacterium]|nr:hypothetical protein [Candidatus Obscuribacterales bacterium]